MPIRSETEIKRKLLELVEQAKSLQFENPSAFAKLDQRIIALLWVLKHPKFQDLILTKTQLDFLAALW